MKYKRLNHLSYWTMALILSSSLYTTACTEDITISQIDESNYTISNEQLGYVCDENGKRIFTNVEFHTEGNTTFYLNASQASTDNNTIQLFYDASVLKAYNARYETAYEEFPETSVTLENDGIIDLNANTKKSQGIKIAYTSDGTLSPDKSYIIPLRIKVTSGNLKLNEADQTKLIFVKDLTGIPDCHKASGMKVFSCMEVNDTNPLNNLSFTLSESGKPLIDVFIMFSANIRFNRETGRVYVHNNENIQALLDKREHYLKPLQDRGIKVLLGILGDHDGSGIGNLSEANAYEFAKEIKAVCDAYSLDGIFIDDEYSEYSNYNLHLTYPNGFVSPSKAAAARLFYEIKQAQPEKWIATYVLGFTWGFPAINGVEAGEYVDYAIHDYGGKYDLSPYYIGMPKSNMGLYSQELNLQKGLAGEHELRDMRANGYGSHMIFAMDPNRNNFESIQMPAMQRVARAFYDEELVFDGIKYPKDWK